MELDFALEHEHNFEESMTTFVVVVVELERSSVQEVEL